jgi:hypothetical protein
MADALLADVDLLRSELDRLYRVERLAAAALEAFDLAVKLDDPCLGEVMEELRPLIDITPDKVP